MIKEIPILFSTSMVQALLEGRKMQTRRLVKWPEVPEWHHPDYDPCTMVKPNGGVWWPHFRRFGFNGKRPIDETGAVKCPYGQPGDILWVRETWGVGCRPDPFQGSIDGIEFKADGKYIDDIESLPLHFYDDFDYGNYDKSGWRPSIHMPKSIARIWLQVTDVRVERLQDISEDDAQAEGTTPRRHRCGGFGFYEAGGDVHECVCQSWEGDADVMGFKDLWCEINGAESWQANPWTWVISFNVLSTTGKPELK